MDLLTNLWAIVMRALEISVTLMTPGTLALYAALVALVVLARVFRGPRLGSFALLAAMIFQFFIIWNHPNFAWFKARPWNGGYVYTLIMVIVYVFIPMRTLLALLHSMLPPEKDPDDINII